MRWIYGVVIWRRKTVKNWTMETLVKSTQITVNGPTLWTRFLLSQIRNVLKCFLELRRSPCESKARKEQFIVNYVFGCKVHQQSLIDHGFLVVYLHSFQRVPIAPDTLSICCPRYVRRLSWYFQGNYCWVAWSSVTEPRIRFFTLIEAKFQA